MDRAHEGEREKEHTVELQFRVSAQATEALIGLRTSDNVVPELVKQSHGSSGCVCVCVCERERERERLRERIG